MMMMAELAWLKQVSNDQWSYGYSIRDGDDDRMAMAMVMATEVRRIRWAIM